MKLFYFESGIGQFGHTCSLPVFNFADVGIFRIKSGGSGVCSKGTSETCEVADCQYSRHYDKASNCHTSLLPDKFFPFCISTSTFLVCSVYLLSVLVLQMDVLETI